MWSWLLSLAYKQTFLPKSKIVNPALWSSLSYPHQHYCHHHNYCPNRHHCHPQDAKNWSSGETAVGKEDATLIRVALCRILGALYCIGSVIIIMTIITITMIIIIIVASFTSFHNDDSGDRHQHQIWIKVGKVCIITRLRPWDHHLLGRSTIYNLHHQRLFHRQCTTLTVPSLVIILRT